MIELKECPFCKEKKLTNKITCKDYSTSKETFNIVSCETCEILFTNPRPFDEDLKKYYASENYISHTNQKKGLFNWLYQNIRKYTVWRKVSLLKKTTLKKNHLDIGCGTGEFLYKCKKEGFSVAGVEPSELARSQAIKNFNLNVSSDAKLKQFKDESFGSISMWHVLEHIPNIEDTMQNLNRIVTKNGYIIIAVPNHKSWDASYYKKYWAAWDVPIHLWHFSKTAIEKMFNRHGFSLIKTKGMVFDAFYVSLLSEEFKFGKKNFIKSFLIGLYSNLIACFSERGHSSCVYIFKKR